MQNNSFISKTIKTFLTSLVISVFVFGSFYFLLSDSSSSTENKGEVAKKKESTPKLVMEEDSNKDSSPLSNTSVDVKKEVLGTTSKSTTNTPVATGGMLAQLNDVTDTYSTTDTTPVTSLTEAEPAIATVPAITISNTSATGVPKTGNEGLYVLMAAFSLISGFLISNGRSLAVKNFEK
jgi:hypothetical protein